MFSSALPYDCVLSLVFHWSIHIPAPAPLLAFVFSFLLAFLRSLLGMLPTALASALVGIGRRKRAIIATALFTTA